MRMTWIFPDWLLWGWFITTALSVTYVTYDLLTNTPTVKVMKWGWFLATLYMGPFALLIYWISCREPSPDTHPQFIAPLWKQAVGSTIHCVAGDASGILLAVIITRLLHLPMGWDIVVEYLTGFSFGLLIFQALFAKDMLGGSYVQAVRKTFLPEFLSMNAVVAGMIPVMVILMMRVAGALEPTSASFWAIMSFVTLTGAMMAYPVNWWLVKNKLKHGMGTEKALGKGGVALPHTLDADMSDGMTAGVARTNKPQKKMTGTDTAGEAETATLVSKWLRTSVTVAMLSIGVVLAVEYSGLSFTSKPVAIKSTAPVLQAV
jgi:hypothetical protein